MQQCTVNLILWEMCVVASLCASRYSSGKNSCRFGFPQFGLLCMRCTITKCKLALTNPSQNTCCSWTQAMDMWRSSAWIVLAWRLRMRGRGWAWVIASNGCPFASVYVLTFVHVFVCCRALAAELVLIAQRLVTFDYFWRFWEKYVRLYRIGSQARPKAKFVQEYLPFSIKKILKHLYFDITHCIRISLYRD